MLSVGGLLLARRARRGRAGLRSQRPPLESIAPTVRYTVLAEFDLNTENRSQWNCAR